jgi:hypothetical protein
MSEINEQVEMKQVSLRDYLNNAMSRASDKGIHTCLGVSFIDVGMLRRYSLLSGEEDDVDYRSFSHQFTMFISPNGVNVFQSFGPSCYSLLENISHIPTLSFQEIKGNFLTNIEKLTQAKEFKPILYDSYKSLFHVDLSWPINLDSNELDQIGMTSSTRPVCPNYKVYTDVFEIIIENSNSSGENDIISNMKLLLDLSSKFCTFCSRDTPEENGVMSKCSRCLKVSYCSRNCQLAHWKDHKIVCIKK